MEINGFLNQDFINVTILDGSNATEMHNKIVAAFPVLLNVATILDHSEIYYLMELDYGESFGFSLNELREYIGLSGLVQQIHLEV